MITTQFIMELMQGMQENPYYRQLETALNSIESSYPLSIKSETIDKGVDSCESLVHSMISSFSSHSEECKDADKTACRAFAESLKFEYKDLFRRHGLLVE